MDELMIENEEWKIISEFPNYAISTIGRVMNITTGRILKATLSNGYFMVVLSKKKKCFARRIHRLVAENFIDNTLNLNEVDHINRCPTDNRVENLRWCTREENMRNRDFNKSVNMYSLDGQFIKKYEYSTDAAKSMVAKGLAKSLNAATTFICECCKYKKHSAYGYVWRYADEY